LKGGVAASGDVPGEEILHTAFREVAVLYDRRHHGFGGAPKFPTPHMLTFLLRYWSRTGNAEALEMAVNTLESMRRGGVYDHIGWGFHRYSTDSRWLVPHFEKMLYDQALLSIAYVEAFQATGRPEYRRTASEILRYVMRDMVAPQGGFYSAEDADSEGEEGKSYLWSESDIRRVLPREDAEIAVRIFNVRKEGNWTDELRGRTTMTNILHMESSMSDMALVLGMTEEELGKRIESCRQSLFLERDKRVHPHKDDKILSDWNGLMIAALAKCGSVLGETGFVEAAEKAADFLLKGMRNPNGGIFHRYRDGQAAIPGFLDDYEFLIWGLIELYEATFDARRLLAAIEMNEFALKHFWDDRSGGFYLTPDSSEDLPMRSKETHDGAIPSGNSVAVLNMARLSRITGDTMLEEKALQTAASFSDRISRVPSGHTQFMSALDFLIGPSFEVVVAGGAGSVDTRRILQALRARFLPNMTVILRPTDTESPAITRIAPYTKEMVQNDSRAMIYLCEGRRCRLPTDDVAEAISAMEQSKRQEPRGSSVG